MNIFRCASHIAIIIIHVVIMMARFGIMSCHMGM